MDSRQFRTLASYHSAANYRSCLSHWLATHPCGRSLNDDAHFIFAQTHGLFCTSKAMQNIYRDAYLAPLDLKDDPPSLPDDDQARIREIVRSRDRARVKDELDRVLERTVPPSTILPLLQIACRNWIGKGVSLWRRKGEQGLRQYLGEVSYWLEKLRKKGGNQWVRYFLNLFVYEAKISFYACFANAWIDILPVLRRDHGLDVVSERFMRVWHNQNQPIEIPHGRTASGLVYPTHIRHDFLLAGSDGRIETRSLLVPTERIGPIHVPDVFSGQVLSLHPLSAIFMRDPALCATAERLFAAADFETIQANGLAEYWDFVGAILTAAHLYRNAADRQANDRGLGRRMQHIELIHTVDDAVSQGQLLEELASAQAILCSNSACNRPLRFVDYDRPDDQGPIHVVFQCSSCEKPARVEFSADVIRDWLTKVEPSVKPLVR
jgi:hypothetical protein